MLEGPFVSSLRNFQVILEVSYKENPLYVLNFTAPTTPPPPSRTTRFQKTKHNQKKGCVKWQ